MSLYYLTYVVVTFAVGLPTIVYKAGGHNRQIFFASFKVLQNELDIFLPDKTSVLKHWEVSHPPPPHSQIVTPMSAIPAPVNRCKHTFLIFRLLLSLSSSVIRASNSHHSVTGFIYVWGSEIRSDNSSLRPVGTCII